LLEFISCCVTPVDFVLKSSAGALINDFFMLEKSIEKLEYSSGIISLLFIDLLEMDDSSIDFHTDCEKETVVNSNNANKMDKRM